MTAPLVFVWGGKSDKDITKEFVDNLRDMGYTESEIDQFLKKSGDINDESRSIDTTEKGSQREGVVGNRLESSRSDALISDGRRKSGEDGRGVRRQVDHPGQNDGRNETRETSSGKLIQSNKQNRGTIV